MLRPMLEMNRTPLDMMILGLQKIAARSETKQVRSLTKEGMDQVIRSRTDRKERVVLRLAWITASRWSEIAALTANNSALEADGTLILDWSVAPKTARADPHRASRFVRIRGQEDAFDTIKLCRTLQGKAHESDDCSSRASFGSLGCHCAFHKTRCVEARCSNRGDIQFGSTRDLAVGEARRPVRPSPEYCLIFVELHHTADPGIVSGRIDVKGETAEGQEPWLRAEERFFHGFNHNHAATITRRATRTRLTTPQEERTIQLQQVNVPVLNLEWIKSRLSPATLERLMQVWGLVGRSPFPPSSSGKAREGSRRIPAADARLMKEAGTIVDASFTVTSGGWIIPFSVVEEKTTGSLRLWIAWPRDKNRDVPYEANVPLLHISHYLPPVMAEAASCVDVKSSFIVSLPRETRHLFRCRVEDGTLVELTRLHMGYKASPEILQIIITSTMAVVTTVVRPLWAAPPLVRIDVWIDNIRIAGSKSDATLWEVQVLRNADSCHASMGEDRESGATQFTFLWVQFDHTPGGISG
ncbi:rab1 small GTP-binding protein [Trypanosoma cruzi]|nr:rab1 small GTP-binding protein [Trypanosoma cruzi]